MLKGQKKGLPAIERFLAKIKIADNGCWIWTGSRQRFGYGMFGVGSKIDGTRTLVLAHRFSYEWFVGPIPGDHEVDHQCHNQDLLCLGGKDCPHRPCVNYEHLELATHQINVLRGRGWPAIHVLKMYCPKGHKYDEVNTRISKKGARFCRRCHYIKTWNKRHPDNQIALAS